MKKTSFKLFLLFVLVLIPFGLVKAETLSKKLSGKILLQVESHGEAWYVNPTDANRYYMADGSAAYNVMRNFGVGITNNNLIKFQNNKNLAKKQSGKIFLQVEDKGQAYYVNSDGTLHYLKNGDAAYGVMSSLGLGITNTNLAKISETTSSPSQIYQDNQDSQYTIPQTTTTTTLTCFSNWQCGSWSTCADSQQTRFCNDVNSCDVSTQKPLLTQACSALIPTPICTPNWQCTAWNSCTNSQQARKCTDLNYCGVTNTKPSEAQSCNSIPEPVSYSDYVLKYYVVSNGGHSGILDYNFIMDTSRDIRIKKIVVRATNMTPSQTVYLNNGTGSPNLTQTSDNKWQYTNEIKLNSGLGMHASGSYGENAILESLFNEWEAWDYTSNKPVKLELTTPPARPAMGTLTVSNFSANSAPSTNIVAGTKNVIMSKFHFVGLNDNFTINKITILNANPDYDRDISGVRLYTWNSQFDGILSNGKVTFSGLSMPVPQGYGGIDITVKADINTITAGAVLGDSLRFDLSNYNTSDNGSLLFYSGNANAYGYSIGDSNVQGNPMTIVSE